MVEPAAKRPVSWAVVFFAVASLVVACGGATKPEEKEPAPSAQPAPAQPAPSTTPEKQREAGQPPPKAPAPPGPPAAPKPDREKKKPAPITPPVVVPAPATPVPAKPEAVRPPEAQPTEPAAAPTASRRPAAKDTLMLTGAPLGGVRLEHKLHVERAGNTCTNCHHPSRPQKPLAAPQQACSDCHTKAVAPPMKTKRQAAFHNPAAQAGTCIDCHKMENAKGRKAPLKCTECHKKENR